MGARGASRTRTLSPDLIGLPVAIRWLSCDAPPLPLGLRPVRIGRSARTGAALPDDYLSDPHAEIQHVDGDFVVRDLGSKNGTFLNGVRIREAALRAGDVLRMGQSIGLVVTRIPEPVQVSSAGGADCSVRLRRFRALWKISASEQATLARVVLGIPNKIIADELGLSISTVEAHLTALLRAARVGNRTALVAKFWSASLKQPTKAPSP